jgi:hypothetical protein
LDRLRFYGFKGEILSALVELKASRPDFPSDEELERRIGKCYTGDFAPAKGNPKAIAEIMLNKE